MYPTCSGDAAEWFGQAQQGSIPTGGDPVVGAIACFWGPGWPDEGHVAYVTAVHQDESFDVTEMGCDVWDGLQENTYQKTDADGFIYGGQAGGGLTYGGIYVSQTPTDPSGILHLQPNETVDCSFTFRNTGTAYWTNDGNNSHYVELHSVNSSWNQDQASGLAHNWISGSQVRIATTTGQINPDSSGVYSFQIQTPATPGSYTLYVALYHPNASEYITPTGPKIEIEVVSPPFTDAFSPCPGDYTGDGKVDVGLYHQPTGGWYVAVSTGSAFTPSTTYWLDDWGTDATCQSLVGDFNDDGKDDVCVRHPGDGAWYVAVSTGSAFTPSTTYWLDDWGADAAFQPLTGDFNGDSKVDVGMYHQPTGGWYVALSDGSSFAPSTTYWLNGWGTNTAFQPLVGDFNADGKTDVGLYHQPTGGWYVALSNGSAFTPSTTYWLNGWGTDAAFQPLAGDFTGDGKTDVGLYHQPTGGWYVAVSTGSAFTPSTTYWLDDWGTDTAFQPLVGDFTGGGDVDVSMYHPPTGGWYVAASSGAAFTASSTFWLENWGVTESYSRPLPNVMLPTPRVETPTLSILPNPASGNVGFRWSLPSLEPATLLIADASGRAVFTRRIPGLGPQQIIWDRRDATGRSVPPGVYFACIDGASGTATRKLVIVR